MLERPTAHNGHVGGFLILIILRPMRHDLWVGSSGCGAFGFRSGNPFDARGRLGTCRGDACDGATVLPPSPSSPVGGELSSRPRHPCPMPRGRPGHHVPPAASRAGRLRAPPHTGCQRLHRCPYSPEEEPKLRSRAAERSPQPSRRCRPTRPRSMPRRSAGFQSSPTATSSGRWAASTSPATARAASATASPCAALPTASTAATSPISSTACP